jgi:hypothetical protein
MSETDVAQIIARLKQQSGWDERTKYMGQTSELLWDAIDALSALAAPSPAPAAYVPTTGNVSKLTEQVGWEILCALHAHVPEDQRPASWSDLAEGQEARILDAAGRAVQRVALTYTQMQSDLAAPAAKGGEWQVTDEMIAAGSEAIDDYYNGTKDAPFEGSVAACYRAMRALEAAAPPAPSETERVSAEALSLRSIANMEEKKGNPELAAIIRHAASEVARVRVLEEENARLWRAVKAWEAESLERASPSATS